MDGSAKPNYSIKSVYRALQVLDIFLEAKKPLTLENISRMTKLPKSTTFRLVTNLVDTEYLEKTNGGYWLSLKLLRFGNLVSDKLDIKILCSPFLEKLHEEFNETIHFGILNRDWRIVYLDKIASTQALSVMSSEIGRTAPFHCTGLGKAIVAHIPEDEVERYIQNNGLKRYTPKTITDVGKFTKEMRTIRELGYAFDDSEHEESIKCIGSPIFDKNNYPVGAISISGPKQRMDDPQKEFLMKKRLKDYTQQISNKMGQENTPRHPGI